MTGLPKPPQKFTPVKHSPSRFPLWLGVIVMLVLVAGSAALGVAIYRKKHPKNSQTAQDIRNIFTPPQATPAPSPAATSTPTPASPPAYTANLGSQAPTPPAPQTYQNSSLGFKLDLPSNWQAQEISANEVALTNSAGVRASVQVYDNFNDSLDTVLLQLNHSPSVNHLSKTTFQGQEAIAFSLKNGQQGLALVRSNRLYYIMGPNLNTQPLSSLVLL